MARMDRPAPNNVNPSAPQPENKSAHRLPPALAMASPARRAMAASPSTVGCRKPPGDVGMVASPKIKAASRRAATGSGPEPSSQESRARSCSVAKFAKSSRSLKDKSFRFVGRKSTSSPASLAVMEISALTPKEEMSRTSVLKGAIISTIDGRMTGHSVISRTMRLRRRRNPRAGFNPR